MNARGLCRWLERLDACAPGGSSAKLRAWLEGSDPAQRWQAALPSSGAFGQVELRCFGQPPGLASGPWASVADAAVGGARAPRGFPLLRLVWDMEKGSPASLQQYRPAPQGRECAVLGEAQRRGLLLKRRRGGPALLRDAALGPLLRELGAQCEFEELVSEWSLRPGGELSPLDSWSLRLRRPLPWPQFARLALANSFSARGSLLCQLALRLRVNEVRFESGGAAAYVTA